MKVSFNKYLAWSFVGLLLVLSSCEEPAGGSGSSGGPIPLGPPDKTVSASDTSLSITASELRDPLIIQLDGLSNQSVYVVKVNNNSFAIGASSAGTIQTGEAEKSASPSGESPLEVALLRNGDDPVVEVRHHEAAQAFNSNPPPLDGLARAATRATYTLKAARQFWVEKGGSWAQIPTTLAAQGTHSNIWVASENLGLSTSETDNIITEAQAATLAKKFDLIYGYETPVFGFELGGADGSGGVDGDLRIQILVYDIDYDYKSTQTGGTLGYFWSKDEYKDTGSGQRSNECEMFYLDAHFTDRFPTVMYSTLIHEFQHMIQYNVKYKGHGMTSSTWYNEMLSMVAEDMIGPLIGVPATDTGHPIKARMPYFLAYHGDSGVTDWLSGDNVLKSYASAYAFGAYLARNYGGPALIQSMIGNSSVNIDSVDAALKTQGSSFDAAMSHYGEALVYSGTTGSLGSFNKTASSAINGTTYTFSGFNIWSIAYTYGSARWSGPRFTAASEGATLRPYGVRVHAENSWLNKTGSLKIQITAPETEYLGPNFYVLKH